MTDILEEILRDQSDERKLRYFKKLLPIVIITTIFIVIAMLINNWYTDKQLQNNRKMGDIFIKSVANLDSNKNLAIQSLDDLIKANDNKLSEIAALQQIGIKINDNDYNGAKNLLEQVINNKNSDEVTVSYARIIWLGLVLDQQNFTEIEKINMQNYLKYFTDEDRPFWGTANIIKASWYVKNNQPELAVDVLKKMVSYESLPNLIKEQAKALLTNLEKEKL